MHHHISKGVHQSAEQMGWRHNNDTPRRLLLLQARVDHGMIHAVKKNAGYITVGGRLLCSAATLRSSEQAALRALGKKHGSIIPATMIVREFSRQVIVAQSP